MTREAHLHKAKTVRGALFSWIVVGMLTSEALAQGYPVRPIRIIDAFPPGGTSDFMLRLFQPRFHEGIGQPFVIDNRPGAQGIVGAEIASRATPDGYTLLMYPASYAIHVSYYRNLPYDLTKSFVPVTWNLYVANVLVVHPSLPARTLKEFIALAKTKPGHFNYASAGSGSTGHLAAELFNSMAGITMTHIPYKGTGLAVIDVTSGHVNLTFISLTVAGPHIRSGSLRALGVGTTKRSTAMPEIPTVAEAGLPGYEAVTGVGVLAPAGTPRANIVKLQQEFTRIINMPDIRKRILELGMEPVGSTPEEFGEHIRIEIKKWAAVIKAAGMGTHKW